MNNFTKEDLIKLKNGLDYLPQSVNLSLDYYNRCVYLMKKLDEMIDNYCEHEFMQYRHGCGVISYCHKCKRIIDDDE